MKFTVELKQCEIERVLSEYFLSKGVTPEEFHWGYFEQRDSIKDRLECLIEFKDGLIAKTTDGISA